MFKNILLFCWAISYSLSALAQQSPKKDSVQFDLHLSSTVILSGGNLQRTVTQNRLNGTLGSKHFQFVTENSYRFGRNFTRVVENDILSRNYIRFFSNQKLYAFVLGTYEDNFKRSIENRWQIGSGAAYNFYQKKSDFFRMSLAVLYEEATYKTDTFNIPIYNGQKKIKETRAILRLGGIHSIFQNHLIIRHDTWFMKGLGNNSNYRWHSLVGFQVPLYKGLAFKTDYDYTYENVTISNKNPFGYTSSRYDWVLSFGLSYDIRSRSTN